MTSLTYYHNRPCYTLEKDYFGHCQTAEGFLHARRYASAGVSRHRLCVCLCVCLSHAGIVSKRLNVYDHAINATIAQGLNLRSRWPTPHLTPRLLPISAYSASTGEKGAVSANRKSTTRFPASRREPCTLPQSPQKGGTKRDFAVFASKIRLLSKKVCYQISLCENSQR